MKKFSLKALIADPPKLHENDEGELISDWRIDNQTVAEIMKRLTPGMKTVETGAGLSTIIFGASGCRHTCIVPDQALVDRIKAYCRNEGVDLMNVEFIVAKSRDVVHRLTPGAYDLALIDGLHGLPTAYVDFCYMTVALREGGIMVVDDMHIFTCLSIAEFMESDHCWDVEIRTSRFALAVKLDETGNVDSGWGQPYVLQRSESGARGAHKLTALVLASLQQKAKEYLSRPPSGYASGYEPELIPPSHLMRKEGVQTLEEWFRWGEEWAMALKAYGGMRKDSRILELECGLGRIAFPLRFQILTGTYEGCDAQDFKTNFLRRHFETRYPNFHFRKAAVHNGTFTRLPYKDQSFDIVYAASVFTHLRPIAARDYLRETGRLLSPGGRALMGVFLLDYFQSGHSRPFGFSRDLFNFESFPDPAYKNRFAVSQRNKSETPTAYKQELLEEFAAEAGLELAAPPQPGVWSGTTDHFLLAEDLLVFRCRNER
jgi:ubiquinone/menaquinone biosynthesis C-methylase UbiE